MAFTPHEFVHQDMGNLFEPDTVLPDQYYAMVQTGRFSAPEMRLMVAVLEDVVACLSVDPHLCSRRQRLDFHNAHSWVNAPVNGDWIFSFANICETLGLDPSYLRRGLNQWANRCDTGHLRSQRKRHMSRYKQLRLRAVF